MGACFRTSGFGILDCLGQADKFAGKYGEGDFTWLGH